jgi:hypothetical protein
MVKAAIDRQVELEFKLQDQKVDRSNDRVRNLLKPKRVQFDAKLTALIELAANNTNVEESRTAAVLVVKRLHKKIKKSNEHRP